MSVVKSYLAILISLVIFVCMKIFAGAAHLICILLHDAVKEKEKAEENESKGDLG